MLTIAEYESAFREHESRISAAVSNLSEIELFAQQKRNLTVGERSVRAAAILEQAFGGISRRLWDDPFEWTLPEAFSTRESIEQYLAEVCEMRAAAFSAFASDHDLQKLIPAPIEMRSIADVLDEALRRSRSIFDADN